MDASRIQTLVDRLLARHGGYDPIELLLAAGHLSYPDYQAWRQGELVALEDGLNADPGDCASMLAQAADWACRLDLVAIEHDYRSCKDGQVTDLTVFRNANANRLARTRYWPPQDRQLSLFFDNRLTRSSNDLARALLAGDADLARGYLSELEQAEAGELALAAARRLVEVLDEMASPPAHPAVLLPRIEGEIVPAARKLLGPDAHDFLASVWRWLEQELPAGRFDPGRSKLHPSWTAEQRRDWPAVMAAVHAVGDWQAQPVLLGRMATAALAGGKVPDGVHALYRLCWSAPDAAEAWLKHSLDPRVERWRDEFWDLAPALGPELLPAWLTARGVAVPLPLAAEGQLIDAPDCPLPRRVFRLTVALSRHPQDLELRRRLHRIEPELFRAWLACRDDTASSQQ